MFKRYIQEIKDFLVTEVHAAISQEFNSQRFEDMLEEGTQQAKMTEAHLKAADLNRTPLHNLPQKEREGLLQSAYQIAKEPAFAFAIDQLIKAQIEETVTKGTTQEHYMMGRFSIAGMQRVRESIETMAGEFEQLNKVDDFDTKSLI